MASNLEGKAAALTLSSMGYNGSKQITGTSAVTPVSGFQWVAIQFMEDSVVAAQTDGSHISSGVDAADVPVVNATLTSYTTIESGTIIYGLWSSITLTSGSAIGYNG